MKLFHSDHFVLPLPAGHRFPMQKYRRLRERVALEAGPFQTHAAPAASDGELALAHTPHYIASVAEGLLGPAEQRAIGFPWSPRMVERARRSVGATIAAARTALREGVAANLAGGTHHAHADRGSGYCVFNDAAVAARLMQAEWHRAQRELLRVLVIDLDVHQGDGTAAIFEDDPTVFTFSMHGAKNFPARKRCRGTSSACRCPRASIPRTRTRSTSRRPKGSSSTACGSSTPPTAGARWPRGRRTRRGSSSSPSSCTSRLEDRSFGP